jgi:hypothetical protein
MTQISLLSPALRERSEPRGSMLVGLIYDWIAGLGRQSAPAPTVTAFARSRAQEAAAVRELARSFESSEPSFAADLYAAALRHESHEEPATPR